MKTTKIIIMAVIIVIIGAGAAYLVTQPKAVIIIPTTPTQVACTMEAKQCPDGSYVGRSGPNCEFAECPTITPTIPVAPDSKSGIVGVVLLGPSCPVMRDPPDPQCADKPYETSLEITNVDGTKVITEFSSDKYGRFKVGVAPGEYSMRSINTQSPFPRCANDTKISVKKDVYTNTIVYCDTGIR